MKILQVRIWQWKLDQIDARMRIAVSDKAVGESARPRLESEVAPYRQPMVTSLGIILGFMLAFLANWGAHDDTAEDPAVSSASDWLIFATLAASILLFVIVLYRLLDNTVHAQPAERYRMTLRLYMTGIAAAFSGLAAALLI